MAQILVIDDDPEMLTLAQLTLQSAGHQVALAADGRQGLSQLASVSPDLVITDLYMPHMDGLETIIAIRRRFPNIAIIAMSGRTVAATMLSIAGQLGAVEVLQKPFLPAELRQAVDRALQGR